MTAVTLVEGHDLCPMDRYAVVADGVCVMCVADEDTAHGWVDELTRRAADRAGWRPVAVDELPAGALLAAADPYVRDRKGQFAERPGATAAKVATERDRLTAAQPTRMLPPGVSPKEDVLLAAKYEDRDALGRVETLMRAVYEYDDEQTGMSTRVDNVEVHAWDDDESGLTSSQVIVQASINDRYGNPVGDSVSAWTVEDNGRLRVDHGHLQIGAEVQGGGFGARFTAHAEDGYRQAGAEAVELVANIDVGGYAWAVYGFDFADPDDAARIATRAQLLASLDGGGDERTRREIADLADRSDLAHFVAGTAPTPYEWAMVGRHEATEVRDPYGGQTRLTWPGKRLLLGTTWKGVKRLNEPALVAGGSAALGSRAGLQRAAAVAALAYANVVADTVPADPKAARPDGQGRSDYAQHHHLISAGPEEGRVLLILADDILGSEPVTAAADPYVRDSQGQFAKHAGAVKSEVADVKTALADRQPAKRLTDGFTARDIATVRSTRPEGRITPGDGELNRRVHRAMRAAYELRDEQSGLHTGLPTAQVLGPGLVNVTFTIYDNTTNMPVGDGVRAWHVQPDGRVDVIHVALRLDDDRQGGGFAHRLNQQAEDVYREAGVDRITLEANVSVGGYAWAVQGYDFADFAALQAVRNRFADRVAEFDDATRAEYETLAARSTPTHFAAGTAPTPYEWAMVGHDRAVEDRSSGKPRLMWPGKETLLGATWAGVKPLGPAPVVAAARPTRQALLTEVALNSAAYAEVVAGKVPVVAADARPGPSGRTDYPEHHHLISAKPQFERVLLDLADELLAPALTAAADVYVRDRHGQFAKHASFADRLAEAAAGEAALAAVPAKLKRAPEGHYGNYEGEELTGPPGMGSVRALSEYEGVEYINTNGRLRGSLRPPDPDSPFYDIAVRADAEDDARIAEIDKTMAVSRLTEDVVVYRVVKEGAHVFGNAAWYGDVVDFTTNDFDEFDRQVDEHWNKGERPDLTGLTYNELGYSSTSADEKVVAEFGKRWPAANALSPLDGEPVIMRMLVPKGTGAVQLAEWGHAAEILVQHDVTNRVVADHGVGVDGFRHLDVEVVPS